MTQPRNPNLLREYRIDVNLDKPFSISFIDCFTDCSYRAFLQYFVKIQRSSKKWPFEYGKALHAGLEAANNMIKGKNPVMPCETCEYGCAIYDMHMPKDVNEKCPFIVKMNEGFDKHMNAGLVQEIIEQAKDPVKAKATSVRETKRATGLMRDAFFRHTPEGSKIVMTETKIKGAIGPFLLNGVFDGLYRLEDPNGHVEAILSDYKSRAGKATPKAFPMRQMSVYTKILRDTGIPVYGIRTIYLIKTGVVTSDHRSLKTPAVLKEYEDSLYDLREEMGGIMKNIESGTFMRNRCSKSCPCEYSKYCFSNQELQKYLDNPPLPPQEEIQQEETPDDEGNDDQE